MTYDFDELVNRRGTGSYKWDSPQDPDMLPMWVADMDFRTAPAIIEALSRRVEQGIFGYTRVPDAYYEAVTTWFCRRHGWSINPAHIIYTSGVVPAVSAIIKALTQPGDGVLVQTPVYNCFFSSIRNNGCHIVESALVYHESTYSIDFEDFERKASQSDVKVFLLCNPHNPACRVWTREELSRMGEICLAHGVTVVSDEIHCELVYKGYEYIPFASVSQEAAACSISCVSPSKAFNIAGLQIANIVCADDSMRRRIDKAININEVCDVNPFGVAATIAAYNEGADWLGQLIEYLYGNYRVMLDYRDRFLPEFDIARLEGTYLVWMDCRPLGMKSDELEKALESEVHLQLNSGTMYGAAGEGFMRWNIACPRSRMREGLERFRRFVECHRRER